MLTKVVLYDPFQRNELSSYFSNTWVGLHKENGVWRWVDGRKLTFPDWRVNEPQNGETCARMTVNGKWAGIGCGVTYKYLCHIGRFTNPNNQLRSI